MNIAQLTSILKKLRRLTGKNFYDKEYGATTFSRLIYASSVVEGISLVKKDITEIVDMGTIPSSYKSAPPDSILQAYGQKVALDWIENEAQIKEFVTVNILQELHKVVFRAIDYNAGDFRNVPVILRKSTLSPSIPIAIRADVSDFGDWLKKEQGDISEEDLEKIVILVAKTYHTITKIHPFVDGNGRTARLFINLILRKYNLPYIIIPKSENVEKMRAVLQKADSGEFEPIIKFMGDLLKEALEDALGYWGEKTRL